MKFSKLLLQPGRILSDQTFKFNPSPSRFTNSHGFHMPPNQLVAFFRQASDRLLLISRNPFDKLNPFLRDLLNQRRLLFIDLPLVLDPFFQAIDLFGQPLGNRLLLLVSLAGCASTTARPILRERDGGIVAAGPIAEVLTAPHLTDTFGLPLVAVVDGQRWSART